MIAKKIKPEPVKTILVIVVGMLVVYIVSKWTWALHISLVVGILGLLSRYIAIKIDFLWMKLTWLLSLVVPNIVLSLIFFLFLTPIAILSRLFGEKNPLDLKNTNSSLFRDYNKQPDKKSFEKLW